MEQTILGIKVLEHTCRGSFFVTHIVVDMDIAHMQTIVCVLNRGFGIEANLDSLALVGTQIDGNRRVGSGVVRDFVQNIVTLAIHKMAIRLIVGGLIIPNGGILTLPRFAAIVGDDYHELVVPTGLVGFLIFHEVGECDIECQLSRLGVVQHNGRREHPLGLGNRIFGIGTIRTIERSLDMCPGNADAITYQCPS